MQKKAAPSLGSLFDGIGGFPLAGIHHGIVPVWASEIEPFPIEVTKLRFPEMLHVGDITKLDGAKLPPVNIVTGGSPCQDLSVAGARAGLQGERSGLFMEQVRIVKEMRDADERHGRAALAVRPRYLVWENVPGAFSSADGEDFRIVLEEIVRIKERTSSVPGPNDRRWGPAGAIVLGDQFSLAWRVLDAQYWGVAQRRKRIFLVADLAGRSAPQILFEQKCLLGHLAPSEGQGQGAAAEAQRSVEAAGGSGVERKGKKDIFAFHINQREETIDLKGISGALMATTNMQMQTFLAEEPLDMVSFSVNQRDEVRDLHDVAAALCAQPGIKQQTFLAQEAGCPNCLTPWDTQQKRIFLPDGVAPTIAGADGGGGRDPAGLLFTAGFSAGAGAVAGSIGYGEEVAPTLKGSASGNMMPSVLCLNDQGGEVMNCSENVVGTLRAQERGHQPLVLEQELFENHGIDARYTGPHPVAPTLSASYGTGGNNVPLISRCEAESVCVASSTISREEGGSDGLGCQEELAYAITRKNRHAVFRRQRSDALKEDCLIGTQTARQGKDATDLILEASDVGQESGEIAGAQHEALQREAEGNSFHSAHPGLSERLIRRLTPLECERLQGFPDGWTYIEGASDSARYKALGNSVAIPCVDHIMQGIAFFLNQDKEEQE